MRWFRWIPTKWPRKFELEKKRWKHLELEFIPQEQTPKEGINHFGEIKIRFIVCLSFIKLNWWPTMDLCILLILLEKDWEVTYRNLRRSSWTTGRIEKNKWTNIMTKEKRIWMNHRKNSKWLMKENESPGRIRRTNMLEGIRCKRTKRSWAD